MPLTRRAHLRRSAFLRRSSSLRPRGDTRKGEGRDPAYLDWVRSRACLLMGKPGHVCQLPIDPHHAGRHGMGQTAPDCTAISLCRGAHDEIHDLRGYFKGWTKQAVRAWEDWQIAETQRRHAEWQAAGEWAEGVF